MIDDKDGHIPSPPIMSTCTTSRHALLEWQKNKGVSPKASKSKLPVDIPDRSNYFKYKYDNGKNASCCAAIGCKLLILPGVAVTYTLFMNTWNRLPQSYQQRVYINTPASVKHQIQQAENRTPGEIISMEPGRVDISILLDYLTSEVGLEEPEIRSTDPNIPIHNNCTDDELHFRMAGGSDDYDDEGDEVDEGNVFSTVSRQWRATTELERFHLGTSDVNWYEGDDGNDADADEEDEASQANDGSTHILEYGGHSTTLCDEWTVYFRPVKYNNGEANAKASDVSAAKTVL